VQRLDQINAFKPANLFDFKSLALKIRKKQIGRFKTVFRPEAKSTTLHDRDSAEGLLVQRGIYQQYLRDISVKWLSSLRDCGSTEPTCHRLFTEPPGHRDKLIRTAWTGLA